MLPRPLSAAAVSGRDAQRLVVVGPRALEVALELQRGAAIDQRVDVGRSEAQRLVEIGDRRIEIVAHQLHQPAVGTRARELAVEPDRLGEIGERAIGLPGRLQRRAALVAQRARRPDRPRSRGRNPRATSANSPLCAPGERPRRERARVLRRKPDRGIEVDDGALEIALLVMRDAAAAVGGGEIRIEPDRLGEVGDRAFMRAERHPGVAAIVEGLGIGAVEADRAGQVGDRPVELALGEPAIGAVEVRDREIARRARRRTR